MSEPTPPYVPAAADPNRKIVVAIDGPAASGKSSTAQWVAQKLGFRHVDSGSLYRAVTAARLRAGGSPDEWSEPSVLAVARQVSLRPIEGGFIPLIRGESADGEIRGGEVTREVSRTARMLGVREWVNSEVRRAAAGSDVVVDGRDIGTVVFPDAQLKIFLVADPWERAKRRLVQRDARDSMQTMQARDAILIDTTYLTQADQVERIVALARGVGRRAQ